MDGKIRTGRLKKGFAALLAAVFLFSTVTDAWAQSSLWGDRRQARMAAVSDGPESPGLSLSSLSVSPLTKSLSGAALSEGSSDPLLGPLQGSPLLKYLPLSSTTVREAHLPAGFRRLIIHIQDIHGQKEAQDNIAASVQWIEAESRRRGDGPVLVAVEGASGPFLTDSYRSFPNPQALKDVSDLFYDKGLLTGVEYAALTGPTAPTLWGVEDPDLYRRHVEAVKEGFPREDALRKALGDLEARLARQKEDAYPPALKEWDRRFRDYHEGKLSLGDYVRFLSAQAPGGDRPNAVRFLQALEREESLDFPKAEAQRKALVQGLVDHLDASSLQSLADDAATFRLGRLSYAAFNDCLSAAAAKAALSLDAYPVFAAYVRYVKDVEKIDRARLLAEIDALETDAASRALKGATADARRVHEISEDVVLATKLLNRTMTPADWGRYAPRRELARSLPSRLGVEDAGFARDLALFEDFYVLAEARNRALVSRLMEKAVAAGGNPSVAVLVTGGFHTDGMTRLLRERGEAYVVLAPRTDKIDARNYLDVFREDKTPLERLFGGEKLTIVHQLGTAEKTPFPDEVNLDFTSLDAARTVSLSAELQADQYPSDESLRALRKVIDGHLERVGLHAVLVLEPEGRSWVLNVSAKDAAGRPVSEVRYEKVSSDITGPNVVLGFRIDRGSLRTFSYKWRDFFSPAARLARRFVVGPSLRWIVLPAGRLLASVRFRAQRLTLPQALGLAGAGVLIAGGIVGFSSFTPIFAALSAAGGLVAAAFASGSVPLLLSIGAAVSAVGFLAYYLVHQLPSSWARHAFRVSLASASLFLSIFAVTRLPVGALDFSYFFIWVFGTMVGSILITVVLDAFIPENMMMETPLTGPAGFSEVRQEGQRVIYTRLDGLEVGLEIVSRQGDEILYHATVKEEGVMKAEGIFPFTTRRDPHQWEEQLMALAEGKVPTVTPVAPPRNAAAADRPTPVDGVRPFTPTAAERPVPIDGVGPFAPPAAVTVPSPAPAEAPVDSALSTPLPVERPSRPFRPTLVPKPNDASTPPLTIEGLRRDAATPPMEEVLPESKEKELAALIARLVDKVSDRLLFGIPTQNDRKMGFVSEGTIDPGKVMEVISKEARRRAMRDWLAEKAAGQGGPGEATVRTKSEPVLKEGVTPAKLAGNGVLALLLLMGLSRTIPASAEVLRRDQAALVAPSPERPQVGLPPSPLPLLPARTPGSSGNGRTSSRIQALEKASGGGAPGAAGLGAVALGTAAAQRAGIVDGVLVKRFALFLGAGLLLMALATYQLTDVNVLPLLLLKGVVTLGLGAGTLWFDRRLRAPPIVPSVAERALQPVEFSVPGPEAVAEGTAVDARPENSGTYSNRGPSEPPSVPDAPAPPPPVPLSSLENLKIGAEIGAGGLGRVMAAEGPRGELLVVKETKNDGSEQEAQALDYESRALYQLKKEEGARNPGVFTVFPEFWGFDGKRLAVTRMTGVPLVDILKPKTAPGKERSGSLTLDEATVMFLLDRILTSLLLVDGTRRVHGDLSLGNMLLDVDDGYVVKFVDGGSLRKARQSWRSLGRKPTGGLLHSPYEAFDDNAPASPATDLYSLFAMALTALTGREVPEEDFRDEDGLGKQFLRLWHWRPQAAASIKGVSPETRALLERGLSMSIDKRPRSLEEALAEVRKIRSALTVKPDLGLLSRLARGAQALGRGESDDGMEVPDEERESQPLSPLPPFLETAPLAGFKISDKILGKGNIGEIREGDLDGEAVAAKRLRADLGEREGVEAEAVHRAYFLQEREALEDLTEKLPAGVRAVFARYLGVHLGEWLVMEKLNGMTLKDQIYPPVLAAPEGGQAQGPVKRSRIVYGEQQVWEVLAPVLDSLEILHGLGRTNGDLKPDNVMMTRGQATFFDLSTSRPMGLRRKEGQKIQGTIPYMAPEVMTDAPASPAEDLYSVGAMGYVMLTGALYPPGFNAAKNRPRDFHFVRELAVERVKHLDRIPGLSAEAREFMKEALSEKPAGRFQSARRMREEVRKLQSRGAPSIEVHGREGSVEVGGDHGTVVGSMTDSDVDDEQTTLYQAPAAPQDDIFSGVRHLRMGNLISFKESRLKVFQRKGPEGRVYFTARRPGLRDLFFDLAAGETVGDPSGLVDVLEGGNQARLLQELQGASGGDPLGERFFVGAWHPENLRFSNRGMDVEYAASSGKNYTVRERFDGRASRMAAFNAAGTTLAVLRVPVRDFSRSYAAGLLRILERRALHGLSVGEPVEFSAADIPRLRALPPPLPVSALVSSLSRMLSDVLRRALDVDRPFFSAGPIAALPAATAGEALFGLSRMDLERQGDVLTYVLDSLGARVDEELGPDGSFLWVWPRFAGAKAPPIAVFEMRASQVTMAVREQVFQILARRAYFGLRRDLGEELDIPLEKVAALAALEPPAGVDAMPLDSTGFDSPVAATATSPLGELVLDLTGLPSGPRPADAAKTVPAPAPIGGRLFGAQSGLPQTMQWVQVESSDDVIVHHPIAAAGQVLEYPDEEGSLFVVVAQGREKADFSHSFYIRKGQAVSDGDRRTYLRETEEALLAGDAEPFTGWKFMDRESVPAQPLPLAKVIPIRKTIAIGSPAAIEEESPASRVGSAPSVSEEFKSLFGSKWKPAEIDGDWVLYTNDRRPFSVRQKKLAWGTRFDVLRSEGPRAGEPLASFSAKESDVNDRRKNGRAMQELNALLSRRMERDLLPGEPLSFNLPDVPSLIRWRGRLAAVAAPSAAPAVARSAGPRKRSRVAALLSYAAAAAVFLLVSAVGTLGLGTRAGGILQRAAEGLNSRSRPVAAFHAPAPASGFAPRAPVAPLIVPISVPGTVASKSSVPVQEAPDAAPVRVASAEAGSKIPAAPEKKKKKEKSVVVSNETPGASSGQSGVAMAFAARPKTRRIDPFGIGDDDLASAREWEKRVEAQKAAVRDSEARGTADTKEPSVAVDVSGKPAPIAAGTPSQEVPTASLEPSVAADASGKSAHVAAGTPSQEVPTASLSPTAPADQAPATSATPSSPFEKDESKPAAPRKIGQEGLPVSSMPSTAPGVPRPPSADVGSFASRNDDGGSISRNYFYKRFLARDAETVGLAFVSGALFAAAHFFLPQGFKELSGLAFTAYPGLFYFLHPEGLRNDDVKRLTAAKLAAAGAVAILSALGASPLSWPMLIPLAGIVAIRFWHSSVNLKATADEAAARALAALKPDVTEEKLAALESIEAALDESPLGHQDWRLTGRFEKGLVHSLAPSDVSALDGGRRGSPTLGLLEGLARLQARVSSIRFPGLAARSADSLLREVLSNAASAPAAAGASALGISAVALASVQSIITTLNERFPRVRISLNLAGVSRFLSLSAQAAAWRRAEDATLSTPTAAAFHVTPESFEGDAPLVGNVRVWLEKASRGGETARKNLVLEFVSEDAGLRGRVLQELAARGLDLDGFRVNVRPLTDDLKENGLWSQPALTGAINRDRPGSPVETVFIVTPRPDSWFGDNIIPALTRALQDLVDQAASVSLVMTQA